MFGTCVTNECGEPSNLLSARCDYHAALNSARNLTAAEFDRLRADLAVTAPVTDDERNARQARYALGAVERSARDLKRYKTMARDAGATSGQIAEAVRRGKSEVK